MGVFTAEQVHRFSVDDLRTVFENPTKYPGMDASDMELLTAEANQRRYNEDRENARPRFSAFTVDELRDALSLEKIGTFSAPEREALLSEAFSRKGDMGFADVSRLTVQAKHGDIVGDWEAGLRPWGFVTDGYQSVQNIRLENRAKGIGVTPTEQAQAQRELSQQAFNKTMAELEMASRPGRTFRGRLAGLNQQAAYSAGYAAGIPAALGISAFNRTAGLMESQYRTDFDGNVYLQSAGDGWGAGLAKGIAGAGAEVFVERVGGKLAGKALLGTGKFAGKQLAKIPVAGAAVRGAGRGIGAAGQAIAKATPETVKNVLKQSGRVTRKLGIDSLPEEFLEEYIQLYPDEMVGLAHSEGENKQTTWRGRIKDAHKAFFDKDNAGQMAFELGMMQVLGAGGNALANARAKWKAKGEKANEAASPESDSGRVSLLPPSETGNKPLLGNGDNTKTEQLETITDNKTGKTFSRSVWQKTGEPITLNEKSATPRFYMSDDVEWDGRDFLRNFDGAEVEIGEDGVSAMVRFFAGGEEVGIVTDLKAAEAQELVTRATAYVTERGAGEENEGELAALPAIGEGAEAETAHPAQVNGQTTENTQSKLFSPERYYAAMYRQPSREADAGEALAQAAGGSVEKKEAPRALPASPQEQLKAAATPKRKMRGVEPPQSLVSPGIQMQRFVSPVAQPRIRGAADELARAAEVETETPREAPSAPRETGLDAVWPKEIRPVTPAEAESRLSNMNAGEAVGKQLERAATGGMAPETDKVRELEDVLEGLYRHREEEMRGQIYPIFNAETRDAIRAVQTALTQARLEAAAGAPRNTRAKTLDKGLTDAEQGAILREEPQGKDETHGKHGQISGVGSQDMAGSRTGGASPLDGSRAGGARDARSVGGEQSAQSDADGQSERNQGDSSGLGRPAHEGTERSGVDGNARLGVHAGLRRGQPDAGADNSGRGSRVPENQRTGQVTQPAEPPPRQEAKQPPKKRIGKKVAESVGATLSNHVISLKDGIGKGTPKDRYADNIEAIKILHVVEKEKRPATHEEKVALSRYAGWGGLKAVFAPDGSREWDKERREIKKILTPEEFAEARRTITDAHYTPLEVIEAMYEAIGRLGYNQPGRVVEGGAGVGHFIGMQPASIRGGSYLGVERDGITSRIAKALYPKADIRYAPFQDVALNRDFFDLAIGNPPYGSTKLTDPKFPKAARYSIHNYFIGKQLETVRPGGLGAFVVSHYFLDNQNPAARLYISEMADFLGAVRLPNTAFEENAGTNVVADIVFFRKRHLGENPADTGWTQTEKLERNGLLAEGGVNSYFIQNPEKVLGELAVTNGRGMYKATNELTVEANTETPLAEQLKTALKTLPKDVYEAPQHAFEARLAEQQNATPDAGLESPYVLVGSFYTDEKGALCRRVEDENGARRGEHAGLSGRAAERVAGMAKLRNLRQKLVALENSAATDAETDVVRRELNKAYDAFKGDFGYVNSRTNRAAFSDDPYAPVILSLEIDYQKAVTAAEAQKTGTDERKESAEKSAIFTRRVSHPAKPPMRYESAKDALPDCLNRTGGVNLAFLSQQTGKDEQGVLEDLGDLVFLNPVGGVWEAREQYLSGNVRKKLAEAVAAAEENRDFRRNIAALEKVIPDDIPPEDIQLSIGASWLPAKHIRAFVASLGGRLQGEAAYQSVQGKWYLGAVWGDAAFNAEWSVPKVSFVRALTAAMNNQKIIVTEKIGDKSVVDEEASAAGAGLTKRIRQSWEEWWREDYDRASELARLYNDNMNNHVEAKYNGSHLTFDGMSPDLALNPHQRDAVWRSIVSRTALLDHVVGAGKTFTAIAAVMEMRRLGIMRKGMIAVPNHLVEQWRSDFIKLYPMANVLAPSKVDFEKEKRRKLFARIQTGDYDAVIIGHSQLAKLEVDPDFQRDIYQRELEDLERAIVETKKMDARAVRDLEKRKDSLLEKMKKLNQFDRDEMFTFGGIGIDGLILDESHEFKNLPFFTSNRGVAGVGNAAGSKKAFDLFVKVRFLKERFGDAAPVIFMTGTPISNSLSEIYLLQRYLQYDKLSEMGILSFDGWVQNFGSIDEVYEVDNTGTNFRSTRRFASVQNAPELAAIYRDVADVVLQKDLIQQWKEAGKTYPIPRVKGGGPQNVVAERSPDQSAYFGIPIRTGRFDENGLEIEEYPEGTLIYRVDHMKEANPSVDNMLKVTNDARKAALDMRLINPDLPDYKGSKVNRCVENVKRIYDAWTEDKGTQLVFCDLSVPSSAKKAPKKKKAAQVEEEEEGVSSDAYTGDEEAAMLASFSVYDDVKSKLMAQGIPANEIAFIHDYETAEQKLSLFKRVNEGSVRVLLGSTLKMGAGTNVQKKLVALHHLDAPWRPSDFEQRNGRIIRQGNTLYERDPAGFEIEILNYATKETYDTRMYQLIEHKARSIALFKTADGAFRNLEDCAGAAADAAEMKAACSGNPLQLRRLAIQKELGEVDLERRTFFAAQRNAIGQARALEYSAKNADARAERLDRLSQLAAPKPEPFSIAFGGETRDKYLGLWAEVQKRASPDGALPIATYRGVEFTAQRRDSWYDGVRTSSYFITAKIDAHDGISGNWFTDSSDRGIVTRMDNLLDDAEDEAEGSRQRAEKSRKEATAWNKKAAKKWEGETRRVKLVKEMETLTDALRKGAKSAEDAERIKNAPPVEKASMREDEKGGKSAGRHAAIDALAKALGVKLAWGNPAELAGLNGKMKDGMVILNPEAGSESHLRFVFGHELAHLIENSEGFIRFLSRLEKLLGAVVVDKRLNELNRLRTARGLDKLTRKEALQEIAADLLGQRMSDKTFWRRIQNYHAPLWKRIMNWVKSWFSNVKAVDYAAKNFDSAADLAAALEDAGNTFIQSLESEKRYESEIETDEKFSIMEESLEALEKVLPKDAQKLFSSLKAAYRDEKKALAAAQDLGLVDKYLRPVFQYMKKVPQLKRMLGVAMEAKDDKMALANELLDAGAHGDLETLRVAFYGAGKGMSAWWKRQVGKYTDEGKRLNQYLLRVDRDRDAAVIVEKDGLFVATYQGREVARGTDKREVQMACFKEEAERLRKSGFSQEAADGLIAFRRIHLREHERLERRWKDYMEKRQALGLEEDEEARNLFEAMAKIGDLVTSYFPRIRRPGRFLLYYTDKAGTRRMERYNSSTSRLAARTRLSAEGAKAFALALSKTSDEEAFLSMDIVAMNEFLENGIDAMAAAEKRLDWEAIGLNGKVRHTINGWQLTLSNLKGKSGVPKLFERLLKDFGGTKIENEEGGAKVWIIPLDAQDDGKRAQLYRAAARMWFGDKMPLDLFGQMLTAHVASLINSRGYASRRIERSDALGDEVIRGYEEDALKATAISAFSIAGGIAKGEMAKKFHAIATGRDVSFSEWWQDHESKGLDPLAARQEYETFCDERRLDSAKQPEAYKEFVSFTREMLRNEGGMERMMGYVTGITAMKQLSGFGSAIVNFTSLLNTLPVALNVEGGIDMSKTMKRVMPAVKAYAQYRMALWRGVTPALSQEVREVLDEIVKHGWDEKPMSHDALGHVQTFGSKMLGAASKGLMAVFSTSEQTIRAASILCAYQGKAEQWRKENPGKTMSREVFNELLKESKRLSDEANFVYGKVARPSWARGSGLPATIGRAFWMYKTFEHGQLDLLARAIRGKHWKAAAWQAAGFSALFGLPASTLGAGAFQAWKVLAELFGWPLPEEPEEAVYAFILENYGEYAEQYARAGIPGVVTGVDLTGSLRPSWLGAGDVLEEPLSAFLGAPGSMLKEAWEAAGMAAKGETYRALETVMPRLLQSPMRAIREADEGVTTRKGKPVFHGKEQLKPDFGDTARRFMGFNPLTISSVRNKQWSEMKGLDRFNAWKQEIYGDVKRFATMKEGEKKATLWKRIVLDANEYNRAVHASRNPQLSPIKATSLKHMVKKQNEPPAAERRRAERTNAGLNYFLNQKPEEISTESDWLYAEKNPYAAGFTKKINFGKHFR